MTIESIENMRVLGMTFLFLAKSARSQKVKMNDPDWELCGTTACHAGWFAVARGMPRIIPLSGNVASYSYQDSAEDMAEFLGFDSKANLQYWAKWNPQLWGRDLSDNKREDNASVFASFEAFHDDEKKVTLGLIGRHWLQVAERVEAAL